ncbi:MAG: hypothetical protein WA962_05495, partial [Ornithinimicrobium sp.]
VKPSRSDAGCRRLDEWRNLPHELAPSSGKSVAALRRTARLQAAGVRGSLASSSDEDTGRSLQLIADDLNAYHAALQTQDGTVAQDTLTALDAHGADLATSCGRRP